MKVRIIIATLIALIIPAAVFAGPMMLSEVQQGRQLATVRKATAKYHDVNVALADGYVPVSPCEELPGEGAMGVHYLHPGLAQDLTSTAAQPEVLLYLPTLDGELKLVAVEYFQADAGQERPSILGEPFNGPMAGHSPDMPTHYDLHVWLWANNPNGMFASWNSALSCSTGDAH